MFICMKYFLIALFFISYLANGQVGIGTDTPNASAKLDVYATNKGFLPPRISLTSATDSSTISSPATGLLVYCIGDAGLAAGYYFWNGSSWATIAHSGGTVNYGDVKSGFQTDDHNGWIKLDGRLISSLTTTQQANATVLGFTTNLPDATDAVLKQRNAANIGSVSGSNSLTILSANLPDVTFSGTAQTAGSHTHTGDVPGVYWTTGTNSGGSFGGGNYPFKYGILNIDSAGNHSHNVTVSSGGSNQALDITPKSLNVNIFIYLG